eukprot:Nk52_evm26s675 gene=Nk52_evmTU26s675
MSNPNLNSDNVEKWLLANPNFLPAFIQKYKNKGTEYQGGTAAAVNPSSSSSVSDVCGSKEGLLISELTKDICSDSELKAIRLRILDNVCTLLDAERAALYIVDHTGQNLVSNGIEVVNRSSITCKSNDNSSNNSNNNSTRRNTMIRGELKVPIGRGIAGLAASSRTIIHLADAQSDELFRAFNFDQPEKGIVTRNVLCCPFFGNDGKIIGVGEVINKHGSSSSSSFTEEDQNRLKVLLSFCTLAMKNAKAVESTALAYKQGELILKLTKSIFSELAMDKMLTKILLHAKELVRCERCAMFMVDKKRNEMYATVFDVGGEEEEKEGEREKDSSGKEKKKEIRFPIGKGIAGAVAQSGVKEIISDPYNDERFNSDIDKQTGFYTRNILCAPILLNDEVVAVAQLVNRLSISGEGFTEEDMSVFVAFAVFCGIAIHNCKLYEEVCMAMNRQKVALSVLSYHLVARHEDVNRVVSAPMLNISDYKLRSFSFAPRTLDGDGTILAVLAMCDDLGFTEKYRIPKRTLAQYVLTVRKNYRNVLYHNWAHAFSVAHCMYVHILKGELRNTLGDLECMGLFFACLCHDLDHRGTNNTFQVESESPLGRLYSTSTMEHHHFDHSLFILNSEGHNIFGTLPAESYKDVVELMEHAILSTDLALYFQKRRKFIEPVEAGNFSTDVKENKLTLQSMLMTSCDVSAITKPWEQQRRIAEIVYSEFYEQGDIEKTAMKKTPIQAMMDREKQNELPKLQIGFIDFICRPLYKAMAAWNSNLKDLEDGVEENRRKWDELCKADKYLSVDEDPQFMDEVKALKILQGTIDGDKTHAEHYWKNFCEEAGRNIRINREEASSLADLKPRI